MTRTTYSVCTICDIGCQLRVVSNDGRFDRVLAHDHPMLARNICYKGVAAPDIHNHAERIRVPLKRVGERGEEALAGAYISSDAVLCPDDDEFLDDEQGVPHFKGLPGRVVTIPAPANMTKMVLEG